MRTRIRMVSRQCDYGDCEACQHPKCECDCHGDRKPEPQETDDDE